MFLSWKFLKTEARSFELCIFELKFVILFLLHLVLNNSCNGAERSGANFLFCCSCFKLKKNTKKIYQTSITITHNFKFECFTNMIFRQNNFSEERKKIYVSTKEQPTLKINPIFKTLFFEWSAVQNWIDLQAPIQCLKS